MLVGVHDVILSLSSLTSCYGDCRMACGLDMHGREDGRPRVKSSSSCQVASQLSHAEACAA